jgi:macrolide-specific efflux system membrane fusion protein
MKPPTHFALLLLPLLAVACASPEQLASEPESIGRSAEARSADAPKQLDLVAVVTSRESRVIQAESEGAVMELLVHADQYVHKGDLVARLDVSELRSKLDQAKGQKARAEGEAGRAYAMASQAQHKARIEARLVRSGASSPEAVHSAISEQNAAGSEGAAAAGTIHEANATIAEVTRLIDAADIKAPIDGVVSGIKVRKGEIAHKATTIARVFDPTDTTVRFALPISKRELVKTGQHLELTYNNDSEKAGVTVGQIIDDHDPAIEFLQVIAELDKTNRPDDIHVGISGHVRLVDKGVAR